MSEKLIFPKPIRQNGRVFFWRSRIEAHKRALSGLPPQDPPSIDVLVPAKQVALEFGFGRRTLARRVAETETAARA